MGFEGNGGCRDLGGRHWLIVLFRWIEFVESNDLGGIFEKNMEYSFNM